LPSTHHRKRRGGPGGRTSTRLCKIGSVRLRSILYFPATVALRRHPPARAFGLRLRDRGKAEMVILCAFLRKLLHVAFGVFKNEQAYDPSLHSTTPAASQKLVEIETVSYRLGGPEGLTRRRSMGWVGTPRLTNQSSMAANTSSRFDWSIK
jgi:hypothetical protein